MRVLNIEKGVPITGLAYSPDSMMLSACGVWDEPYGEDEHLTVWIWDASTGESRERHILPSDAFEPRITYSPDGRKLATWSDPPAVLDLTRPDPVTARIELRWGNGEDGGLCFSHDGLVLHGLRDGQLTAANAASGKRHPPLTFPIRRVAEHESYRDALRRAAHVERYALGVSYSPAGPSHPWRYAIIVRDEATGIFPVIEWTANWRGSLELLELSANGERVAARSGNRILVWDVNSARELASFTNGRKHPTAFGFTACGRYLGVLFQDSVSLYDTATWIEAKTYSWKVGKLLSLAFSPDGATAAVASNKGKVVVFDLE